MNDSERIHIPMKIMEDWVTNVPQRLRHWRFGSQLLSLRKYWGGPCLLKGRGAPLVEEGWASLLEYAELSLSVCSLFSQTWVWICDLSASCSSYHVCSVSWLPSMTDFFPSVTIIPNELSYHLPWSLYLNPGTEKLTNTDIYAWVNTHSCMQVCMCVYLWMCVCVCAYMYIHPYIKYILLHLRRETLA